MPTIAAGSVATVYCPLASTITITPGSAGRVSLNGQNAVSGVQVTPQEIYGATTLNLSAGDRLSIEAINTDATYTEPAGIDTSLQALVSVDGRPAPWKLLPLVNDLVRLIPDFALSQDTPSTQRPFPNLPWQASTAYVLGAVRSNSGNLYICRVAGVSAGSGGPTTTESAISDGTVTWRWLRADPLAWAANTSYSLHDMRTNLGALYICTVAGTSAGSGGPNANNTSIADNTVTWCRIQQQWLDSSTGDDANAGTSPSLPKRSMPSSLTSNTHYWVSAGSEFIIDCRAQGIGVNVNATRTSMTVVDSFTKNEITTQPNPFLRALRAGWVSQSEKSTSYFKLTGNGPALTVAEVAALGTNGRGFGGTTSTTQFKLRGAYISGFPYGGIATQAGGNYDISDCIIEDSRRNALTGAVSEFAGCGIRLEGTSGSVKHRLSRLFISGSGEDAFWASAATAAQDWQLNDCAIHHSPRLLQSTAHGDALQFGSYPGSMSIRRVVVEHDMSGTNYISGEAHVGAAIIQDSSGTVTTEAWAIEDSIFISTQLCTNFQRASTGNGFRRCLFALMPNVPGVALNSTAGQTFGAKAVHNANTAWTLTDCVNVQQLGTSQDVFFSGNVPSVTGGSNLSI